MIIKVTPIDYVVIALCALSLFCLLGVIAFGYAQMPATPTPLPAVTQAETTFRLNASARAAAESLYTLHCAACHGADGEGSATGARLDTPRIRSLIPVEELRAIVNDGIVNNGTTMMIPYGQILATHEIEALITLLREGL
jgi:mono/diheme cytochrome c family protein